MKRIITYSIIALLQASVAFAQTSPKPKLQKREKYEWQGEIPTYVETLKKELTYPMAWGNSPIRNFKKWKKAARAKVLECMMTPPKAAAAWDMEVLGEEQRDGYKAQKIAFNINAYSRITAYLLIPDGKGPFPTVNVLHDHGAHLFIGKENGGFANCIPGLRQYLDYPHIASLACPKPMLFINGTKDKLFPVPGVKDAFAEMHKVWKSQGADNLLDTELWEIPHSCGLKAQEKMLEFLDKNLK